MFAGETFDFYTYEFIIYNTIMTDFWGIVTFPFVFNLNISFNLC